jgi:predicted transcriptional regulator
MDVNGVNGFALPPSARKIYTILQDGNPRTFKDMVKEAGIAPRTIRYAIKCLKDNGLIIEKFNFRDARQIIYQKNDSIAVNDDGTAAVIV